MKNKYFIGIISILLLIYSRLFSLGGMLLIYIRWTGNSILIGSIISVFSCIFIVGICNSKEYI